MSVSLPNGSTVAIASAYGSAKTVTIATNANPIQIMPRRPALFVPPCANPAKDTGGRPNPLYPRAKVPMA